MIFSYFILFDLFNVNEHLAVPFVELAIGGSRMGHLRFFCLHWITCLRISTVIQAYSYLLLEICYLHFAFCLYGCSNSNVLLIHLLILLIHLFQWIICNIHSMNPLIYRGLGFLKNHGMGDQNFLVNMGEGRV